MKETTLEEYKARFDLDGEGGDLLGETARETLAWLEDNRDGDSKARQLFERWLHHTGFTKCPCPACKRGRGEPLQASDLEYEKHLRDVFAPRNKR